MLTGSSENISITDTLESLSPTESRYIFNIIIKKPDKLNNVENTDTEIGDKELITDKTTLKEYSYKETVTKVTNYDLLYVYIEMYADIPSLKANDAYFTNRFTKDVQKRNPFKSLQLVSVKKCLESHSEKDITINTVIESEEDSIITYNKTEEEFTHIDMPLQSDIINVPIDSSMMIENGISIAYRLKKKAFEAKQYGQIFAETTDIINAVLPDDTGNSTEQ